MAENPPPTDPADAEKNIKKWFNEVLDERAVKADADKAEADRLAAEEAERNKRPSFMQMFLGG
jgi:hypothetical protein